MKKLLLAMITSSALAAPALASPDFVAPTPHGDDLSASPGTAPIGPLDDVLFEHDSARLLPGSADQLTTVARWLAKHPKQRVVIEGYTDLTGRTGYNEDLATQRASKVRAHLVSRGVRADRIVVLAYGESGAEARTAPLDRRVVMYATDRPIAEIVQKSFAKGALTAAWQSKNRLVVERRGQARAVVSRR